MKRVPKKNIDPVIVDIKKQGHNYSSHIFRSHSQNKTERITEEDLNFLGKKRSTWTIPSFGFSLKSVLALSLSFLLLLSFALFDANRVSSKVVDVGGSAATYLADSLHSIKDLELNKASNSLRESLNNLEFIREILYGGPRGKIVSFFSSFMSPLRDMGSTLVDVTSINRNMLEIVSILDDIQDNGFTYFQDDGEMLIDQLIELKISFSQLRGNLNSLRNRSKDLEHLLANAGSFSENVILNDDLDAKFIGYSSDILTLENLLEGLISLLDSHEERNILLMFQNSSEIRPAGGFLGSYGVLTVQKGEMKSLVVEDIYWPDHSMNFDLKLVPPAPLQHITTGWGARDANWFFDFPTSAKTVIDLLESSSIYKEDNLTFDGAIALNIDVLGSLIEFVGPINIEEYEMIIDENNFLAEIQREVEIGRDAVPGENPKKVLSFIAPAIIDGLNVLNEAKKQEIIDRLGHHMTNKDIMIYTKDSRISNFLNKEELSGSLFNIPSGFWGNYIAVANANIAGGKTDVFIDQSIRLDVELFTDGVTLGNAYITREHKGGNEEDYWYNTDNVNYAKFFLNRDSQMLLADGTSSKQDISRDYSGYDIHESLGDIFQTRDLHPVFDIWETKEFNRDAYGYWTTTKAGEKNEVHFRYRTSAPSNFQFQEGEKFRLVIDKQSGVDSEVDIVISAPSGFIWQESNSRIFRYQSENMDSRLILELIIKRR